MADDVTVEAVVNDGRHPDEGRRAVRFAWSARDPLAVRVELVGTRVGPWVVSRDTLREGLSRPTGIGQVRIGPVGRHVALTLHASGRMLVTRIPAERLRAFLDQTDAVVGPGDEPCGESLDAALGTLLDGS